MQHAPPLLERRLPNYGTLKTQKPVARLLLGALHAFLSARLSSSCCQLNTYQQPLRTPGSNTSCSFGRLRQEEVGATCTTSAGETPAELRYPQNSAACRKTASWCIAFLSAQLSSSCCQLNTYQQPLRTPGSNTSCSFGRLRQEEVGATCTTSAGETPAELRYPQNSETCRKTASWRIACILVCPTLIIMLSAQYLPAAPPDSWLKHQLFIWQAETGRGRCNMHHLCWRDACRTTVPKKLSSLSQDCFLVHCILVCPTFIIMLSAQYLPAAPPDSWLKHQLFIWQAETGRGRCNMHHLCWRDACQTTVPSKLRNLSQDCFLAHCMHSCLPNSHHYAVSSILTNNPSGLLAQTPAVHLAG